MVLVGRLILLDGQLVALGVLLMAVVGDLNDMEVSVTVIVFSEFFAEQTISS